MSKPAIDSIQYAAVKLKQRTPRAGSRPGAHLVGLANGLMANPSNPETLAAIQAEVLCLANDLNMSGERLLETTHAKTKLDKARLDAEVRSA